MAELQRRPWPNRRTRTLRIRHRHSDRHTRARHRRHEAGRAARCSVDLTTPSIRKSVRLLRSPRSHDGRERPVRSSKLWQYLVGVEPEEPFLVATDLMYVDI